MVALLTSTISTTDGMEEKEQENQKHEDTATSFKSLATAPKKKSHCARTIDEEQQQQKTQMMALQLAALKRACIVDINIASGGPNVNASHNQRDKDRIQARHDLLQRLIKYINDAEEQQQQTLLNEASCHHHQQQQTKEKTSALIEPNLVTAKESCGCCCCCEESGQEQFLNNDIMEKANTKLLPFFHAIQKRNVSVFGVVTLVNDLGPLRSTSENRNYYYYNWMDVPLQLPRQPFRYRTIEMCASRFGVYFTQTYVKPYLDENIIILEDNGGKETSHYHKVGITLLEYAVLVGEFQIAGSLLRAGADPTRYFFNAANGSRRCRQQQQQNQLNFYKLFFFQSFPPMLAVWTVRCVMMMRLRGYYHRQQMVSYQQRQTGGMDQLGKDETSNEREKDSIKVTSSDNQKASMTTPTTTKTTNMDTNEQETNGFSSSEQKEEDVQERSKVVKNDDNDTTTPTSNVTFVCQICQKNKYNNMNNSSFVPLLLEWGEPCYHCFCEECFWQDFLKTVFDLNELQCPICQAVRQDKPPYITTSKDSSSSGTTTNQIGEGSSVTATPTSRRERGRLSLMKFITLPLNAKHLRVTSEEKGRIRRLKNQVDVTWNDSVLRSIGRTQRVRSDALWECTLERRSLPHVRGCLMEGCHVNTINEEYHQTPLYVACWYGLTEIVRLLLHYGADPTILPNGHTSSCLSVAQRYGHTEIVHMITEALQQGDFLTYEESTDIMIQHDKTKNDTCSFPSRDNTSTSNNTQDSVNICPEGGGQEKETQNLVKYSFPSWSSSTSLNCATTQQSSIEILIPLHSSHPGGGSFIIDHCLPEQTITNIIQLWESLPIHFGRKKQGEKSSATTTSNNKQDQQQQQPPPSSTRKYYCDAEGNLCRTIASALECMKHHLHNKSSPDQCLDDGTILIFPHIRFLHYEHAGISLAPHVDLSRVDTSCTLQWSSSFTRHENDDGTSSTSESNITTSMEDNSTNAKCSISTATTIIRSTHSFLLYLTDVCEGGATTLLEQVVPPSCEEEEKVVLARVQPKRGRILVFPHDTPHEGETTIASNKLVVRGELVLI